MPRVLAVVLVLLASSASLVEAQQPLVAVPGPWGYVPDGNFGYFPGYGYTPYGGYGYIPFGGLNAGNGYGPWNYAQQLYQQQSSQTQQIFQQQQQAIIDRIDQTQERAKRLESAKQAMFEEFLRMNESDKQAIRADLLKDFINLDPHFKEKWMQDALVRELVGKDLGWLDRLVHFQDLNNAEQNRIRQTLLTRYRSLSPAQQEAWRNNPIMANALGRGQWMP